MPKVTLTAAHIEALGPRETSCDTRDAKLREFGVRMTPTGRKRFFIQCQHRGEHVWKIVGDAGTMSIAEERASAAEMLAAVRRDSASPTQTRRTRRPRECRFLPMSLLYHKPPEIKHQNTQKFI